MFEDLTGVDKFYLLCAIIGGGMFILRSVLMFIGLGGDDLGDDGGIGDGGGMGDGTDIGDDGTPVTDFKMVSVHSLTAFLLMFGLVGFLVIHNYGQGAMLAATIASLLSGLFTMYVIAKLFSLSRKLQSDGSIYAKDAIGCEGSVYLGILPGDIGKIQVTVNGALKVFDARCSDSAAKLKTGDRIKVVAAGDVLVVEASAPRP